MSEEFTSLGLMSGTSGDGVDASIIQSNGNTKYKVLRDKYLLYDSYTAGNNDPLGLIGNTPSTIEDSYVVYVDDVSNPSEIVGYRDNETWYNASGLQISDPNLLAEAAGGAGGIHRCGG